MVTKLISTSLSVTFDRQIQIRRRANDFEDRLKGRYHQPLVVPVPDEMDPEIPRIVFQSLHGFSQLIVSQISVVLTAIYSPDWQVDMNKGQKYFKERGQLLFELLDVLENVRPFFCGVTNRAHIVCSGGDRDVLNQIAEVFFKSSLDNQVTDVKVERTTVVSGRFYSNTVVRNFRLWPQSDKQQIVRLPSNAAVERGIEILCDFNDRYAFNESDSYISDKSLLDEIIRGGFFELQESLHQLGG